MAPFSRLLSTFTGASALAVLSLSLAAFGQNPAAPTPEIKATGTFRTGSEFVQVPIVVQRSGKHVSGLTKTNFVLQQDGKEAQVATFEEVHATAPAKATAGPEFENTYTGGNSPQQITIIAFDTVNTPPMDQAYFKKELLDYLSDAKGAAEPMGLLALTRSGIRVLHDFSTDPRTLYATVQRLDATHPTVHNEESQLLRAKATEAAQLAGLKVGDFPLAPDVTGLTNNEERMSAFQDTTARIDSLLALQQLAQALKGFPGRKTVLWVGSGFQFLSGVMEAGSQGIYSQMKAQREGEAFDQHAYTWKLLNDANVAIYPIDTRRTVNAAYEVNDPSFKYSPTDRDRDRARENDTQLTATFQSLAAQTGGKPCVYRTDLHNCIKEAAEDNHDYYLLGFYVDKNNNKPGWHKISVKMDQKAEVRYRQGFMIAEQNPEVSRQTDLQLALNSPFNYTSLPFQGKFIGVTDNGNRKTTSFELKIPPDSITIDQAEGRVNFDVVAVVRAVGGAEATRLAQRINRKLSPESIAEIKTHGIDYTNKVVLPPGDYGVWFVVRDNPSGRTGSVVVPLKVAH